MTLSYARNVALCVFAGMMMTGLSGCRSSVVQASSGGSAAPMSDPPVYNEEYAARNPRLCRKVLTQPTPEEAKALVQCNSEKMEGGMYRLMYLATEVQVEMGPVNSNGAIPLRGQATGWQCSPVSARYPAGKNCARSPAHPGSKGSCGINGFNEWECSMSTGTFGTQDEGFKGPTAY